MTISSTVTSVQPLGNGVATAFQFPNKVFSTTDLVVTLIDTLGNLYPFVNFANATLGLSYVVNNVDVDQGCSVVFSGPPAVNWIVDIRSATPDTQSTSIKNQGSFFPELHEEAFDRATRMIQDLLRQTYTYGIHGPDLESIPWPALPAPANRKSLALVFDGVQGLPTVGAPASATFTGQQLAIQGTDSGVANAYIYTHTGPVPATLTVGALIRFTPLNTNTGAATLNADATGVKNVVRANGAALTGGEFSSLGPVVLQYNGSAWQIVSTAGAQPGFERSLAETTALVVPTAYGFYPNDVRRYGAVGDGVTDNTAAFTAAINVARYSGRIEIRNNGLGAQTNYACGELPPVFGNTHVWSENGVVMTYTGTTVFHSLWNTLSTWTGATNLSANAVAGSTTVQVAALGGFAVGQVVTISDQTFKFGSSGQNLELNEIASISGAGPFTLTMANELIGNYNTANTASIKYASLPARNVRFEGLNIIIPSTADGGGFLISDSYECDVIGCAVVGPKSQSGVTFWRSAYCHALYFDVKNAQSPGTPGYGYGVSMGASAHDCIVYDSTFRNVRENSLGDNVRYSGFISCDATRPVDNGFSTHGLGATDCFFINCRSYWSQSKGFVSYSQPTGAPDIRIRFQNCISFGSQYDGFFCACASAQPAVDLEFIDCVASACGQSVATSYGWDIEFVTRPRLINCRVDGTGSTPADLRAGIFVTQSTDVVIKGGEVTNVSAGWGIIHDTCTRVLIESVRFQGMGGNQVVHSTGTASTGVVVRGCRSDTNTFDKNAGDIYVDNYWNGQLDAKVHTRFVVPYSASITWAAWIGDFFDITATNGTAFTINAPTNLTDGQEMTVTIRNTSGGALGAVTWNAVFKMAAWVSPANGFSRSITFRYDSTRAVWDEVSRCAADIPN